LRCVASVLTTRSINLLGGVFFENMLEHNLDYVVGGHS
jgi:hypothetical protein